MSLRHLVFLIALSLAVHGCASSTGGGSGDSGDIATDGVVTPDAVDGVAADDVATDTAADPDAAVVPDSSDGTTVPADTDPVLDAAPPEDTTELPTEGACLNETDQAALADLDMEMDDMMGCYNGSGGPGNSDPDVISACIEDLLHEGQGLTKGCAACMSGNMLCLNEHCMDKCMALMNPGADPGPCDSCLESAGCNGAFATCSGLSQDDFSIGAMF
jgi:hypothetical protein